MPPRPEPARIGATGPGDSRIRPARRNCGPGLPATRRGNGHRRWKAEPFASLATPEPLPSLGLLLLLVAFQAFVLVVVLAGGLQIFRGLLRVDMAVDACFLGLLSKFRFAVRR